MNTKSNNLMMGHDGNQEPGGILTTEHPPTIREGALLMLTWVRRHNNCYWTSAQIAKRIGRPLASVASILLKLCKEGTLERKTGVGPRGGYGYRLRERT